MTRRKIDDRDDLRSNETVYLFYDGFEQKAEEKFIPKLYNIARCNARHAYRSVRQKQTRTGFYEAFRNLVASLKAVGAKVHINDFSAARRNPGYPIGLSGYKTVLDKVRLPNPAIFGPGDFGLPSEVSQLREQNNVRTFTLPCEWICASYRDQLGGDLYPMPVAIDTDLWSPSDSREKAADFLVYDKIRWRREQRRKDLLTPALEELERSGLTYNLLRYGAHHVDQYRTAIRECRALLFVCEHETQGLAYQEAMASGLPVLAWDEGELVDPIQSKFLRPGITVSSVPYFDERCGVTFTIDTFRNALEEFMDLRDTFAPRDYVIEKLSKKVCGHHYLDLYHR